MSEISNPYQAPAAVLLDDVIQERQINMVSGGRRFLHFLIDTIILQIGKFLTLMMFVAIYGPQVSIVSNPILGFLWSLSLTVSYYIWMESQFQRTIGKMVTGTIVTNENGSRPSLGQVVKRTFSRYVPFEPFSCFGKESRGWHDEWSKTYVVRAQKP